MSAVVNAGRPVPEGRRRSRKARRAPAAPSGFFDAAGRYSGAVRKPRPGAAGADNKARERRYPLYADEDLMHLVGWGDAAAFAVLYDRHGRTAYSLAHRMIGEKQAAEDLTQEAFLKVWRSAGRYRAGRGSVRTWVLSIVHNRGVDQLRSLASRRRTQERTGPRLLPPNRARPLRRPGAAPCGTRSGRPSASCRPSSSRRASSSRTSRATPKWR